MRQGITTRYLGPTNTKGSRVKAAVRKRSPLGPEMSLTDSWDYAGSIESNHTRVARLLADKLGWAGLWVGGGNATEEGYHYVCKDWPEDELSVARWLGEEGVDWFYVPRQA